jgi:hypothetical protein
MNRDEAIEALALLKSVVGKAKDDTAVQNWGVIWMVHGITNGAGFIATNWLFHHGHDRPWPFILLWAPIVALNLASIPLLKRQRAGVRSFVETQIWVIWTGFVAAVVLMAYVNYFMGLQTLFVGPAIAVMAALTFAYLASIVGRAWYAASAVFAVASLVMALVPSWQFAIFGVAWAVTKVSAGFLLDRARRRRLALEPGGAAEVV